jgi:hypothetical protein
MNAKSMLMSLGVILLWTAAVCAQTSGAPNFEPDLSPEAVKQAYAKIAGILPPDRLAAMAALDCKLQVKLWLLHYSLFEANHSLNDEQRALINELKQLRESKDCVRDESDINQQLRVWRKRALELFGVEGARVPELFRIGSQKLASQ